MEYTIDDLKGKYVKVGTPEAEVFLDACEALGVKWRSGATPRALAFDKCFFAVDDDNAMGYSNDDFYISNDYEYFTPKQQWSIYTNDKPLCELSNEQAAALFNAWRKGCVMQSKNNSGWCDLPTKARSWYGENTYRIKQKSECELFVDVAVSVYDGRTGLSESAMSLAAEMMFKSGKFKLVEGNNK